MRRFWRVAVRSACVLALGACGNVAGGDPGGVDAGGEEADAALDVPAADVTDVAAGQDAVVATDVFAATDGQTDGQGDAPLDVAVPDVPPADVPGDTQTGGDAAMETDAVDDVLADVGAQPDTAGGKDIAPDTTADAQADIAADAQEDVGADAGEDVADPCANPAACVDGDPCTVDACNPTNGACTHEPAGGPVCDDGNPCTASDACADGQCAGTPKVGVSPGPCVSVVCDPVTGTLGTTPVADGEACPVTAPCDATATCQAGVCVGQARNCDDQNTCTVDACAAGTGACTHDPVVNGAGCNADNSVCTSGDACQAGVCVAGALLGCDDNNVCTSDSCDPVAGCVHPAADGPCDLKDSCFPSDTCVLGTCVHGASVCNCAETADCQLVEDGNACNGTLVCVGGKCTVDAATVVVCDAALTTACTVGVCDPGTGACSASPVANGQPCDADGSVCTAGDACQGGVCVAGGKLGCDDQQACTLDSCDAVGGCAHVPTPGVGCNDGSACTQVDACSAEGACVGSSPPNCDDANVCTSDLCDPKSGCTHVNLDGGACEDGSVCTVGDACKSGQCGSGSVKSCDDGKLCTTDTCDATAGCQNAPNTVGCDDGNTCTTSDTCSGGACIGSGNKVCDDSNGCTSDSCDPVKGCVFVNNTAGCTDGSVCTQTDTCSGGGCVGSNPQNCNDNDPCTTDSCDGTTGCAHTPASGAACASDGNACTNDVCASGVCSHPAATNGTLCDDGNACTVTDQCQSGSCAAGTTKTCNDSNACTTDSCNASTGACVNTAIAGCGATFTQVYQQVIVANGCTSGCHGTTIGAGGLSMGKTQASAYTSLVNKAVSGSNCAASVYVSPNNAAASLFWLKIAPGATMGCGNAMPPSGGPLSQTLADLTKSWINAGAQNN